MSKVNINVEMTPEEFDEYRKYLKDKKYYQDIREVNIKDVLEEQFVRLECGECMIMGIKGYSARYQSSNKKATIILEVLE